MTDKTSKKKKSLHNHSEPNERLWFLYYAGHRLKELQAFYEHGSIAALFDALKIVRDSHYEAPEWVKSAAVKVIGDFLALKPLNEEKSSVHYKKYQRKYRRWQVVRYLKNTEGLTSEKAFEKATELLAGEFAGNVKPKVIEEDFYIVEKALKDPSEALNYYRPSVQAARIMRRHLKKK